MKKHTTTTTEFTKYELHISKTLKEFENEVKQATNPDDTFKASVARTIERLQSLQSYLERNQSLRNLRMFIWIHNTITRVQKEMGNK